MEYIMDKLSSPHLPKPPRIFPKGYFTGCYELLCVVGKKSGQISVIFHLTFYTHLSEIKNSFFPQ